MTFRDALDIINVQQKSKGEYILTCKYCGKWKVAETDDEAHVAIEMATEHTKCRRKP